jgi:hypothetical protein
MMKLRLFGNGIVIIYFLILLGCTLKAAETTEVGDRTSPTARVLIATQKSKFKQTVVSEIRNNLVDKVSYVKVVDVKWLPYESADDYHSIVILNRCMAGRPDPRVESFVDDMPDKQKVVLLTTGRLDSWKPDSPEIDAMSSASAMSETAPIARTISDKVLEIIETRSNQ